jgi:hypothetical protein
VGMAPDKVGWVLDPRVDPIEAYSTRAFRTHPTDL